MMPPVVLLSDYEECERERDDARAEVERLREELELSVQLRERVEAEYERELDRLRAALQDAATYLRLGMTWTEDTDRHVKLKAAWERAKKACDESS